MYIEAPAAAHDWSILEDVEGEYFSLFSTRYRNNLLKRVNEEVIPGLKRVKNRDYNLRLAESCLQDINRQISYLLNRCQESYNIEYMNEVRSLRTAKKKLLRYSGSACGGLT